MKISELKIYINELIKEKVESFIYPVFDKIAKKYENGFNQKILKLKNNYPIDNREKQVEIGNIILSFENMNKNMDIKDKIELINDILSIKFKNIENEIEKIFSAIFDNKDSSIYEIKNYWTKEIYKSDNNEFGYDLEENNCLAKKVVGNKHLIKSKLKLKEGNKYIFIFNIVNEYNSDEYIVGFISNESLQLKESENLKGTIFLSNEGLFINGIKTNANINMEDKDEICFILLLKEEKLFHLFKNGKYIGQFHFDLIDIYAFAYIENSSDSIKLKTFIEL